MNYGLRVEGDINYKWG